MLAGFLFSLDGAVSGGGDSFFLFSWQCLVELPTAFDGEFFPESVPGCVYELVDAHGNGFFEGVDPSFGGVSFAGEFGSCPVEGLPGFVVTWQWLVSGAVCVGGLTYYVVP